MTAHAKATAAAGRSRRSLGRVGLVGQGVLATVVGIIAIQIAMGDTTSETATSEGAVAWLAEQPLGRFLLVALTVSLFALAAWRIIEAFTGDPVEGSEAKDRAKYAVLGFIYLSLAVTTLGVTIANWTGGSAGDVGTDSGDAGAQEAASTVFDLPAGRFLVAAGGIAVIGYGLFHIFKESWGAKFAERLEVDEGSWVVRLGRVGYAAQGLVYMVVGWFLLQAAISYDADEAKGPSGALVELAGKGWGSLLLWAIAIGLFCYGLFCVAEAKYRRAT
jgi:hypothetical protein